MTAASHAQGQDVLAKLLGVISFISQHRPAGPAPGQESHNSSAWDDVVRRCPPVRMTSQAIVAVAANAVHAHAWILVLNPPNARLTAQGLASLSPRFWGTPRRRASSGGCARNHRAVNDHRYSTGPGRRPEMLKHLFPCRRLCQPNGRMAFMAPTLVPAIPSAGSRPRHWAPERHPQPIGVHASTNRWQPFLHFLSP